MNISLLILSMVAGMAMAAFGSPAAETELEALGKGIASPLTARELPAFHA
jgi:hypothetical protein